MSSGVQVDDECKERYTDMKMRHMYGYILFRLSDDLKLIIVEKLGPKGATYHDMVLELQAAEVSKQCRYALFDLAYVTRAGTKKNKILAIAWSPDSAKVKEKMVYAATKNTLKKALGDGIGKDVQANDMDDLDYDCILEEVLNSDRN